MADSFFITKAEFDLAAKETMGRVPAEKNQKYWADHEKRWGYHEQAIRLMKNLGVDSPDTVIELGAMGVPLVKGSVLMDYDKNLEHYIKKPDVLHDARRIPWPIKNKKYDWFVALRVFHHLWPVQRECFEEARRIANNIIIVAPVVLPSKNNLGQAREITPDDFRNWNQGIPPSVCEPAGSLSPDNISFLYMWNL